MIKPVNGHLLIEPMKHESFIAQEKATYEEIGIVIEVSADLTTLSSVGAGSSTSMMVSTPSVSKGDKVYFDSWLASKYPNGDGFYWLVKWEDVRAVEIDVK